MPKTELAEIDAQKKAHMNRFMAEETMRYDLISAELRGLKAKLNMSHHDIAKMLGLEIRTWQKRIAEPDTLKHFEARRIMELARLYGMEVSL